MAKKKYKAKLGDHVVATSGSLHEGHKGTVFADHGRYIVLLADDDSYKESYKSPQRDGKYFHVDATKLTLIKETK